MGAFESSNYSSGIQCNASQDICKKINSNPNKTNAALIIGLCYCDTDVSLPDCRNNLVDIADNLSKANYNITCYNDFSMQDKTIQSVTSEFINNLSNETKIVLFYYSGHGTRIENNNQIDGYEECLVNPNLTIARSTEMNKIFSSVNKNAKIKILIDACFSAEMLQLPYEVNTDYSYQETSIMKDPSSVKKIDANCYMLCSSSEYQLSYADGSTSTGQFTNALKAILHNDTTWVEALKYIQNSVDTQTAQLFTNDLNIGKEKILV